MSFLEAGSTKGGEVLGGLMMMSCPYVGKCFRETYYIGWRFCSVLAVF